MPCPKIVECLRRTVWIKLSSGFELEQYDRFHDHVRPERADASSSKIHGDRNLGLNAQACVLQRKEHRVGINRLEKSGTQLAMYLKEDSQNPFGDLAMQKSRMHSSLSDIPLIPRLPRP